MRAISWETLLTCCFTPHRLFSFLERAGSSQTQSLPATRNPTARKHKQPRGRRAQISRICATRSSNRPDKNAPGDANANIKPKRFIAANSEPPGRTARRDRLMGPLMPSMPGKPRPASSSRRRAQGHSPPARCSSCQNRASWRAGPWCS